MPVAQPRPTASPADRTAGQTRPRVVVAGGGVAALEAVLALRSELGAQVAIDLVAPERNFVYRPTSVAEPFGLAGARRLPLAEFSRDRAQLHVDRLERVDADRHQVTLESGVSLPYDALLLAMGARPAPWLEGALHFGGPEGVAQMRGVLDAVEEGHVQDLAFVVPDGTSWSLPLYELALLTAAWVADRGLSEVGLALVTPEPEPLALFGPSASAAVRDLLADRGVRLHAARHIGAQRGGTLTLRPAGAVAADRLITLPRLHGVRLAGVPNDGDGFVPVDAYGAVTGLTDVYAAGDGTTFPVKQGGLATQQADAAATAIAAALGAPRDLEPFRPLLRGVLLTGIAPTYLRTSLSARGETPEVAIRPLWWPPGKIAGRYLAPFLAEHPLIVDELADRHPAPAGAEEATADHEELLELARTFAQEDSDRGEYASALEWLEAIERLQGGVLSAADAERRARWQRASRS